MDKSELLEQKLVEAQSTVIEAQKPHKFQTLDEVLAEGALEAALDEQTRIETDKFLFPLSMGKLYTIVGITNVGKTWWSLATALSLAREMEDGKIGFITTEDTKGDLFDNLGNTDVVSELVNNKKIIYKVHIDTFSMEELEILLQDLVDEGCRIIVMDYLRPDLWEGHKDNANLTMSKFYQVYRNFLEKNLRRVSIIQTVQANASLYAKDFYEQVKANPEQVLTKIDGGYTASKRSHGVGFLIRLEKENMNGKTEKAWYFYVAKVKGHKYFGMNGKTYRYTLNPKTFNIEYNIVLNDMAGKKDEVLDRKPEAAVVVQKSPFKVGK